MVLNRLLFCTVFIKAHKPACLQGENSVPAVSYRFCKHLFLGQNVLGLLPGGAVGEHL